MTTTKADTHPEADKIALLLVSGMTKAEAAKAAVEKLGIPPDQVDALIVDATRKIQLAADYNREEQIGVAITRLQDIYSRALRASDNKTALAAQRELNGLLALREKHDQAAEATHDYYEEAQRALAELDQVRAHLLPLNLAPPSQPLAEHARIAADRILLADPP